MKLMELLKYNMGANSHTVYVDCLHLQFHLASISAEEKNQNMTGGCTAFPALQLVLVFKKWNN